MKQNGKKQYKYFVMQKEVLLYIMNVHSDGFHDGFFLTQYVQIFERKKKKISFSREISSYKLSRWLCVMISSNKLTPEGVNIIATI